MSQLRLSISIWKRVCVCVSSALHLACIIWKRVCVRVSSALHLACISAVLNLYLKSSQIGIWCSGTKKCSQRYQTGHFCKGNISAIRTSNFFFNPIGGPSVSFPQYPIYLWLQAAAWEELNWRLVSCDFEIYGSSIGVCNWVCKIIIMTIIIVIIIFVRDIRLWNLLFKHRGMEFVM